jgi:hypothetical protein
VSTVLKILEKRRKILDRKTKIVVAVKPQNPLVLDSRFVKQNAFVNSKNRFIAAQCSRRAGKSSGLALRFFKTMERYPKSTCIYLSLTFDSAKSIMWPVLQELNEKFEIGCTFLEGKMVMTHPNGSRLRLYGADQRNFIKRLKGQKAPAIAVDEAQDFGSHLQSLIDDILTPMMVDYRDSWLALTGTPGPVPRGYFFETTSKNKYGYEVHKWTLMDNPYLISPEMFINSLIEKNQWEANNPTLLREWRNLWILDVEGLWIKYDEKVNDFEELPKEIRQWNYICGVDLGFYDADAICVLAWSEESPNIYLVEEIITPRQGLTPLVKQIQSVIERYDPHKIMIDSGGHGCIKMAEEMRIQFRIPVEPAIKKEKQQTVEFLNDTLRLGKFKAHKDSRFVQDSYLVEIDWEKSTPDKIVLKNTFHSDVIDAVIYAYRVSPFYNFEEKEKKPKPGTKEYDDEKARELFEHHVQQLERKRAQTDSAPCWETDPSGVPPWLKFDE